MKTKKYYVIRSIQNGWYFNKNVSGGGVKHQSLATRFSEKDIHHKLMVLRTLCHLAVTFEIVKDN